jgi:hypothetical protein
MGDLILPRRRGLILGGLALLVAPSIVRASSLMPVVAIPPREVLEWRVSGWDAAGNYIHEFVRIGQPSVASFKHITGCQLFVAVE